MIWTPRKRAEQAIDEGHLLADRAARLEVRNRIEVETIGRGRDFDPEEFRGDAVAVLRQLADEQDAVAARLDVERRIASGRDGYAASEHDYQRSDRRNLRRRAKAARLMAAELRAYADDEARVMDLVERARQEAWRDVAGQMHKTLRIYAAPPEYDEDPGRQDRLMDLAAELAAEVDAREFGAE
ncbi:MAG TPA: asparagine synthase [Microbacteriaceae bacterium]|nr:asparagine synthase [Microbacteriaceae bacterium]